MMFDKINRRTHLYLGIMLAPWFLLYAASSIFLNHGGWFQQARSQEPPWTRVFERDYRLPPFNDDSDQWVLAEKVLKDFGMEGRYRAYFDDDDNLVALRNHFFTTTRLTYYPAKGRIVAEEKRLRFDQFLTSTHFPRRLGLPLFSGDAVGRLRRCHRARHACLDRLGPLHLGETEAPAFLGLGGTGGRLRFVSAARNRDVTAATPVV